MFIATPKWLQKSEFHQVHPTKIVINRIHVHPKRIMMGSAWDPTCDIGFVVRRRRMELSQGPAVASASSRPGLHGCLVSQKNDLFQYPRCSIWSLINEMFIHLCLSFRKLLGCCKMVTLCAPIFKPWRLAEMLTPSQELDIGSKISNEMPRELKYW